ncbi:uncharacterized protein LOC142775920 [Rhipicephalus microplus]|uniref:uncharacterized protein LOC142775920 n=1 Tax=Rhipicephalus microplus TaxID=6941 RepID=UPI003F6A90F8
MHEYSSSVSSEEREPDALQDSAINKFISGIPRSTTSGRRVDSFMSNQQSCAVEVSPAPSYEDPAPAPCSQAGSRDLPSLKNLEKKANTGAPQCHHCGNVLAKVLTQVEHLKMQLAA